MFGLSIARGIFSVVVLLIIIMQYINFWIFLDVEKTKPLKYILPMIEIITLVFFDGLFLFSTVVVFLLFVYKDRKKSEGNLNLYYNISMDNFSISKKKIFCAIFLAPLLILLVNLVYRGLYTVFEIFDIDIIGEWGNIYKSSKYFVDYLMDFGLICIIAPIVEEFTFRVIIYGSWLSDKFNKRITAVIISSIIFAFSHFNMNIFLYTFITGIILCFIYDILGYVSSVIVHMLFNTYAFFGVMGIIINIKLISVVAIIMTIIAVTTLKLNNFGIFRSRS